MSATARDPEEPAPPADRAAIQPEPTQPGATRPDPAQHDPAPRTAGGASRWEWALLAAITLGAALLRLIDLGSVNVDPYYDAAVRSMGTSLHNFLLGAFEPGGSVSIDKPPVDLWLQVASVKLFGFDSTALKLPQALAGTLSVPLLYLALRRTFGAGAALGAALALAVLPIEVITARSDTMDAVMMLLLVLALALLMRACESGRTALLLAAAAVLGIAFNVKLLESLVALPGLALIACLGFRPRPKLRRRKKQPDTDVSERAETSAPRERLRGPLRTAVALALALVVYLAVALSWLTATLLVPAHERPYAIGSTNGSAWNAAFVFNGLDRIRNKGGEAATIVYRPGRNTPTATAAERERFSVPAPSPTRLLSRIGPLPIERLGLQALAALLLGLPAALFMLRGPPVRRGAALGLALWLLVGLVLFSHMARLHPRYVEGFTPAVAALLGIGAAWLAHFTGRARGVVLAVLLAALLAIPLQASIRAVRIAVSDAGVVGSIPEAELRLLSSYLRSHQGGARYEVAAASATRAAALIVHDARPVIMLTTYEGRVLTSIAQLRQLVARGEVRYALLSSVCGRYTPRTDAACSAPALWVRAHATDVSRAAGLGRGALLWRLP
ncbi:MAG TPA: glycosyltransferase family 39 protein [Solirubrobacteraceae bacterium]|jgi:4-amino-4-deoxy-L-arabinose transferase-like glycosyltransferase